MRSSSAAVKNNNKPDKVEKVGLSINPNFINKPNLERKNNTVIINRFK